MGSKFLLMWNDSKKLTDVPDKENVKSRDLMHKAYEIFPELEGQDLLLQLWNTDFEEFINTEAEEVVPPMSKVKIVVPVQILTLPVTIPLGACAVPTQQEIEVGPSKGASASGWIATFKLPALPDLITDKIKTRARLSTANETVILDTIFEAVQLHTLYPTPSDYMQLVEQLLLKYPLFTDLSMANQKQLWIQKLKHKFQNTRKRDPTVRESLEVKNRKRKQPPAPKGQLKKIAPKYPPMWGLQNYLPDRLESEDETTIAAHNNWLQIEITKKRPDYKEVGRLMGLTFADRRHDIIQGEQKPISQRKEQYPWLFTEHELLAEFHRIHGSSHIKSLLQNGLDENASSILECYSVRRNEENLISAIKGSDSTYVKKAAAIEVLPSFLKENIQDMFSSKGEENQNAVYIEMDDKSPSLSSVFKICAEGDVICIVDDITTAVACYLAVFYTFHLQYVSSLVKTISFYQFALLHIDDGCRNEKRVLTLKARLEKKNRK